MCFESHFRAGKLQLNIQLYNTVFSLVNIIQGANIIEMYCL